MDLIYPQDPAQSATYDDFCKVLERLYNNYLLDPASIEINPVDEWRVSGLIFPSYPKDELKRIHFASLVNRTTGTVIPLMKSGQVRMGTMRFLNDAGVPMAQLGLYPLAGEALAMHVSKEGQDAKR